MLEASNISNSDNVLTGLGYKRPAWQSDALCKEHLELAWFPRRGESPAQALAVCARCLVLDDCKAWALADPTLDHAGVLDGQSALARTTVRRLAAKRATTAEGGHNHAQT